jgi:hypothetical protein
VIKRKNKPPTEADATGLAKFGASATSQKGAPTEKDARTLQAEEDARTLKIPYALSDPVRKMEKAVEISWKRTELWLKYNEPSIDRPRRIRQPRITSASHGM